MSKNSVKQFVNDINAVIKRHKYESDMTGAEYVGGLEFVKAALINDAFNQEEDECESSK